MSNFTKSIVLIFALLPLGLQSQVLKKVDAFTGLMDVKSFSYSAETDKYIAVGKFKSKTLKASETQFTDHLGIGIQNAESINGTVYCQFPDGNGGKYLGGKFDSFLNVSRSSLAHVNSQGQVTGFNISVTKISQEGTEEGTIRKLFRRGNLLYLIGDFSHVNQVARKNFAVINLVDLTVTNQIFNTDGEVYDITGENDHVFVVGTFTKVNGISKNKLFMLENNGTALSPYTVNSNSEILAIEELNGKIYIAGSFSSINGVSRDQFAALDANTAELDNFQLANSDGCRDLAVYGNDLFIPRNVGTTQTIQRLNTVSGTTTELLNGTDPNFHTEVLSFNIEQDKLYISGAPVNWSNSDASSACFIYDLLTNSMDSLSATYMRLVTFTFPLQGKVVLSGCDGEIEQIRGLTNLAVFDGETLQLENWCLNFQAVDGYTNNNLEINSAFGSGDTLFIAGVFTQINGVPRRGVAALNIHTGALLDFEIPGLISVEKMVQSGNQLIIDATNSTIANPIYAFSVYSKATQQLQYQFPYTYNLYFQGIRDMDVKDNQLYIGGKFDSIMGSERHNLAVLNLDNFTLAPSTLTFNDLILRVKIIDSLLVAEGAFYEVNGLICDNIAVYNLNTQSLTDFGSTFGINIFNHRLVVKDGYFITRTEDYHFINPADRTEISRHPSNYESYQFETGMPSSQPYPRLEVVGDFICSTGKRIEAMEIQCADTSNFSITTTCYYTWNNVTYDEPGDYIQKFTSQNGCDSTAILHLSLQHSADTIYPTGQYYVTVNGVNYTQLDQNITQHFTNMFGCDSTLYIIPTIDEPAFIDTVSTDLFYDWQPNIYTPSVRIYESGFYWKHTLYNGYIINNGLSLTITDNTQDYSDSTWVTDGMVTEIFETPQAPNSLFVTGSFSYIGPNQRFAAVYNTSDFNDPIQRPKFNGAINAVVSDGQNGFFIGGNFTRVGDSIRNYLVHLDENLQITNWNTNLNTNTNGGVLDIQLYNDDPIVCGNFTVNGQINQFAIRISHTSGSILTSYAFQTAKMLDLMGDTLVVAGSNVLRFFNSQTGAIITSKTGIGQSILSLAITSDLVHVLALTTSGNPPVFRAFKRSDLSLSPFNPNPNVGSSSGYYLKALGEDTLLVYGNFTTASGQPRQSIAAFKNGALLPVNFNAVGQIRQVYTDPSHIYLFGTLTSFSGQTVSNNIQVSRSTLSPVSIPDYWYDAFNNLMAFATSGSYRFFGGGFKSFGGKVRNRFAEIDKTTGKASDLKISLTNSTFVNDLAMKGDTLFLAGNFSQINGINRSFFATVNYSTGAVLGNNIAFNSQVRSLELKGQTLYTGGDFTLVGGQSRGRLATIDLTTLTLTSWNPVANGKVNIIQQLNGKLLVGGEFTTVSGQTRKNFASFDLGTGAINNLDLGFTGRVNDIAISDSSVYFAGNFLGCNNGAANYVARFKASNFELMQWSPQFNGEVLAISLSDNYLFGVGTFTQIQSAARNQFGAVLISSQLVSNWSPNCTNMKDLHVSGDRIFLAGDFDHVNQFFAPNLANLPLPEFSIQTDSIESCTPYTWINGLTYSADADSVVFASETNGENDIVNQLYFNFNGANNETIIVNSCGDYFWPETGLTYQTSGQYTAQLTNSSGCDSIITLDLIIQPISHTYENTAECGNSYTWPLNNQTYNLSGNYTDTVQSFYGCDSIVTLNLSLMSFPTDTIHVSNTCEFPWSFNNQIYYTSGLYSDTIINNTGCQVIKFLDFQSYNTHDTVTVSNACTAYYWNVTNDFYYSPGFYTANFVNSNNCDSVIVLNLDFVTSYETTETVTSCDSYIWAVNNQTYTASGIYSDTVYSMYSCDSIVHLDLTIAITPLADTIAVSTCDTSYLWTATNQSYNTSGYFPATFTNAQGCDSVVVLHLELLPHSSDTIAINYCGNSYLWTETSQTYNTSGFYTVTYTNAQGCDSVIVLNLTMTPSVIIGVSTYSVPSDDQNCNGQLAIDLTGQMPATIILNGGTPISSSGYNLVNNLCPGLHTLSIIENCGDTSNYTVVIPADSNFVYNNGFIDSLAADSLGYTLNNCDIYYNGIDTAYIDSIWTNGNQVTVIWNIIDSNGSNFDTANYVLNNGSGVYLLQLTIYCTQKSMDQYFGITQAIYFNNGDIEFAGLTEPENTHFNCYPNPSSSSVTVESDNNSLTKFKLFDSNGRLLENDEFYLKKSVSISEYANGVYLLYVEDNKHQSMIRIVKN